MNETGKLITKIIGSILLVVIVYFLFSYLAAAIISHTVYVFELKDLAVPLVLGLVVEYMDIVKLAKDNMVGEIVVGLPRNMDGTEGWRADICREFAQKLGEATGLPIVMWDERRTTVEAHNILSQHNYHGQKRKNTVDAVAAGLILEGYLNSLKR